MSGKMPAVSSDQLSPTKLTNKLTDDHKATQGKRERELRELNYRINILSISLKMVSPSQLGLRVHTVYWRGLRLPVGHLSDVIRNRWRQTSHHVTSGEVPGEVCLLLVSLPPPAEMKMIKACFKHTHTDM